MMVRRKNIIFIFAVAVLFLAGSLSHFQAQQTQQQQRQEEQSSKDILGALRYRYIGPVGNRTTAVAGVPGQPNIYYVGAASGGIFKTIDGGTHWTPVLDNQPVSSIGSLAVAPSDPNVVW